MEGSDGEEERNDELCDCGYRDVYRSYGCDPDYESEASDGTGRVRPVCPIAIAEAFGVTNDRIESVLDEESKRKVLERMQFIRERVSHFDILGVDLRGTRAILWECEDAIASRKREHLARRVDDLEDEYKREGNSVCCEPARKLLPLLSYAMEVPHSMTWAYRMKMRTAIENLDFPSLYIIALECIENCRKVITSHRAMIRARRLIELKLKRAESLDIAVQSLHEELELIEKEFRPRNQKRYLKRLGDLNTEADEMIDSLVEEWAGPLELVKRSEHGPESSPTG